MYTYDVLESYTMSYFAIYLMLRTAKKKKNKPKTEQKPFVFYIFFIKKNEIIKQSCSDRKKNVIELVRLN